MKVHLVDGTYELFRAHFGAPPATAADGSPVGAARGLLRTLLALLASPGVTHVACAFDHVIESFRNDLYAGYKTSDGVPPELLAQFPLAEELTHALGVVVWPMVEMEADDALATAAARWAEAPGVEQVVICSPDKDLAQCVRGDRVVCLDRRQRKMLDEAGVREKFGVLPNSMPDWLALVGDSADGYPGIPRWGEKSAAAVLARYGRLEAIPEYERQWEVAVRGAAALGASLRAHRQEAALFRVLATLREDAPLPEALEDLAWRGGRRDELQALCARIGEEEVVPRMPRWRPA
ncbi:MAG TPA: 5'-3' exonuclease H3TH domain-containing protein [Vicinamibacteria bacterium]|nr:5'-3' exonuclease H3TH domain-containing protein [Vicinamibacteria bacterium]